MIKVKCHKLSQINEAEGNSKTSARCRSRRYVFTVNNYKEDDIKIIEAKMSQYSYIIGEEVGANGTPHLQGYVEHKDAIDFNYLQKIIPRGHIEKAKGNLKQNYAYCSKDGKFKTNIIPTWHIRIPIKDPLDGKVLYKWQSDVINNIKKEPDDRTINWIWNYKGNNGKSALVKHIALKNEYVIVLNGKQNDMYNAILQFNNDNGEWPMIVLIDIPRSNIDYVSWTAIENIKNGCFYSGKYEGGMCVFNSPHIYCFANSEPDFDKLSKDRWNVINI